MPKTQHNRSSSVFGKNVMHYLKPLLFIFIIFLSACDSNSQNSAQTGTPEYVAVEFFNAIYNEKDLTKAKGMSTHEFANLLNSYGSVRQVSRTLFNMNFDNVEINANRSSRNLREQYDTDASIQLIFDGEFDDKRVQDTRTVVLVKQRSKWLVKEVKADKFSTSIR